MCLQKTGSFARNWLLARAKFASMWQCHPQYQGIFSTKYPRSVSSCLLVSCLVTGWPPVAWKLYPIGCQSHVNCTSVAASRMQSRQFFASTLWEQLFEFKMKTPLKNLSHMCLLRLTMNTMHGQIQSRETVPLMVVYFFLYCKLCTVKPLRCIIVALFPVWNWDRGPVLFNAEEIQSASYNPENCWRGDTLLCLMKV